ncbi:hypothetical protein SYNPS1DRAFT_31515 [Syncephalis pseudoplumigaleata]|uniref:Uncharacterized protein n=1 Tax=Syncephalis pseudoplumigaleata TaxID=1712513 RepID=A0A4P9YSI7_9FUNG|nr:hypothetical protein SYNPS1DRAFT_31515 [Syncephalis pseudoplumigaleata]|eukprot:RKP22827.1 hypothetical protein SYNPS1DRAFT_31515 [Syncephalis pseudoplumigaleata]
MTISDIAPIVGGTTTGIVLAASIDHSARERKNEKKRSIATGLIIVFIYTRESSPVAIHQTAALRRALSLYPPSAQHSRPLPPDKLAATSPTCRLASPTRLNVVSSSSKVLPIAIFVAPAIVAVVVAAAAASAVLLKYRCAVVS